ncbi:hypothetical protein HELRODRAFT_183428 [Helobdella robusta]|uniref:Uncharacterized protein n=1 Tax=Helobdella robusta TaxID=6412 RepID=T1FJM8_HELRO|nr:hypothetical protein HELRODRAFT_183428 [Helobdella robusta]ESO11188.1 hypothetical protein HELRODRAFT_183428 [Helobdella robusta]
MIKAHHSFLTLIAMLVNEVYSNTVFSDKVSHLIVETCEDIVCIPPEGWKVRALRPVSNSVNYTSFVFKHIIKFDQPGEYDVFCEVIKELESKRINGTVVVNEFENPRDHNKYTHPKKLNSID